MLSNTEAELKKALLFKKKRVIHMILEIQFFFRREGHIFKYNPLKSSIG